MAGIPQVITEDRASGAQFIDGSLKFDGSKSTRLTNTFTNAGNRTSWTWSCWVKRDVLTLSNRQTIFGGYGASNNTDWLEIGFDDAGDDVYFTTSSVAGSGTPQRRDPAGWYHFFSTYDGSNLKIYVNNNLDLSHSITGVRGINNNVRHFIGQTPNDSVDRHLDGKLSQCYFIDGQVLNPSDFAYTDPLTNTWRPKKFDIKAEVSKNPNNGTTWSSTTDSGLTYANGVTGIFDGNLSTRGGAPSTNNNYAILTDNVSISCTNGIRIYWNGVGSGQRYIRINGTTEIDNGSAQLTPNWSPLSPFSGTINKIEVKSASSGSWSLAAIEVDGYILIDGAGNNSFYLPMDGNSPIGEDKSGVVTPNDGTIWSDLSSATNITAGNVAGFFQGDTSSCSSLSLGTSGVFLLTKDIPNVTKIGLHSNTGAAFTMKVNEGLPDAYTATVTSRNNVSILDEFTGFTGTIHTLSFSGFGAGVCLNAIEINGHLLIDGKKGNDFTPSRFGGSVELPKATGAIPVLKTNEAGTVAKGVRTDRKTHTVTASGGNYYLDGALKPTLNAYRGGSYTFDYTGATSHPLYLSSLPDGKHNSKAYSVEFGGSDYLSVPDSDDFDLAGNDWTIEAFVYHSSTNYTSYEGILAQWALGSGTARTWTLETVGSGSTSDLEFYYVDSSNNQVGPVQGGTLTKDKWHHVAACRSGNTIRMFVDGVMYGSGTTINVDIKNSTDPLWIGRVVDGYWNGHISNARVVNGTALYTTNFTPPQTTLTNVTNTKLLCCQDSDATTGAVLPSGSAITVNGSAAASQTRQPFLYDNNHGNFGLNLATSNTTKITIPHTAADTLYYYCNAHSGMGSSINVTTDIFKADPYAWKNVLNISLNGNAKDISNEINFNSTAKSISTTGASASSAQSNFYRGSYYFNGSNTNSPHYLDLGSTGIAFNNNSWTIETWFYGTDYDATILATGSGWNNNQGLVVQFQAAAPQGISFYQGSGSISTLHVPNVPRNVWHHLAMVGDGQNVTLYVDGVNRGTISQKNNIGGFGDDFLIGAYRDTNYQSGPRYGFKGHLQEFRVYEGVAKYTDNFFVGSTAPDVLPDTPSGITGKSKLTKITDGAVYFNGSSEQHMDAGSALINTNNSFCVEAFAYLLNNPTSSDMGMICSQYASGVPAGRMLYGFQDGYLALRINGTAVQLQSAAGSVGPNSWYHTAWTWDGTTHRLFLDGKLVDSSTSVPAPYTGTNTEIGGNSALNGYDIKGYISNFRIVTGSAVYTGDFTPPTEKLTNITNTSLLCCQSNTQPSAAVVGPRVSGVNNGTGWSSSLTSDSRFRSGFPGWKAFNGTTKSSTNDCAATPQTAGLGFTFTFGGGVPFTTLQMQCDPNGGATVKANGVDITSQLTNGSLTNTTITGVTSPLTSLSLVSHNGDAGYLGSVTLDSTMLVDPLIRNTSTIVATNFNPLTDDINAIRGQETGYATWNPLCKRSPVTLSNGNLTATKSGSGYYSVVTTMTTPTTGKWYYEVESNVSGNNLVIGIAREDFNQGSTLVRYLDHDPLGYIYRASDGYKANNNSDSSYGDSYTAGDVVGIALDLDAGDLTFYKNGASQGVAYSNLSGRYYFGLAIANGYEATANFGQKPFKFPPPDGFQPLNHSTTQPEKVIARPDQYVDVSLWTGNGTSQNITGLKHKPDLVWIKSRSFANNHHLFDSVRGPNKILRSSTQDQESTTNVMTSFNNDGFTVAEAGGNNATNDDTSTFVGWTWKAGGNKNTFNIDDVGYANASDVNMNVGAFNNYNTSRMWSNGIANSNSDFDQAKTNAFNGDRSNKLRTGGNAVLVTLNFSPALTVANTIQILGEDYATANFRYTVTVDGTTMTMGVDQGQPATFNVSGSLTQITFVNNNSNGRTYLEWIKVDGKELIDSNVTINTPSIAPTGCSVGTKQGFSIIKWQGDGSNANRTVPHGLLEAPSFVIVKPLTESRHWLIWHKDLNDDAAMLFDNGTPAGSRFGPNAPTSNVFGVYGGQGNRGTTDFIGYCWHDVSGLQKFGKYVGSGNADGTFVELGFRPALLWIKSTGAQGNWVIVDTQRDQYNPVQSKLYADYGGQENVSNPSGDSASLNNLDILSNGFKMRSNNSWTNSVQTYIYCAWAEAPSMNLYGAQANAR